MENFAGSYIIYLTPEEERKGLAAGAIYQKLLFKSKILFFHRKDENSSIELSLYCLYRENEYFHLTLPFHALKTLYKIHLPVRLVLFSLEKLFLASQIKK